jgi:hypothetical protein
MPDLQKFINNFKKRMKRLIKPYHPAQLTHCRGTFLAVKRLVPEYLFWFVDKVPFLWLGYTKYFSL